MRHDDRLSTVLQSRPNGPAMRRIQWRQLVDLLGTTPAGVPGAWYDPPCLKLTELSLAISPEERSRILAEPGMRLRSPQLVATLAAAETEPARAALHAANLDEQQWLDLVPALSPTARGLLASRRDLPLLVQTTLNRLGACAPALPSLDFIDPQPDMHRVDRSSTDINLGGANPASRTFASPTNNLPDTSAPDSIPQPVDDIASIVRRIETFRRARDISGANTSDTNGDNSGTSGNNNNGAPHPSADGADIAIHDSPQLPLSEDHTLPLPMRISAFDFVSETQGRIVWGETDIAPMIIGLSLVDMETIDGARLSEALNRHQPMRAIRLRLRGAEAISGDWQIDATARFDTPGGHFIGHMGRFRRINLPITNAVPRLNTQANQLREMLHELRTPVGAIQGFAEIIQQQLFGPAPHAYRALASSIMGDSALLLGGFEELERFAQLDSGAMSLSEAPCDLVIWLAKIVAQLTPYLAQRGVVLHAKSSTEPLTIALAPADAERLIWRLLACLTATCATDEHLDISLEPSERNALFRASLPASLAVRHGDTMFGAHLDTTSGQEAPISPIGMFGTGFALRLCRAEAQSAGGSLRRNGDHLLLTLPRAASPSLSLSDSKAQIPRR